MGHYYDHKGNPRNRIKGANGKERNTNIADARKHKLVPSVSGIIGQLDKPSLTRWKLGKLYEVFFQALEQTELENLQYVVWDLYKQSTEQYSIEGTRVHDALENYYKTGQCKESDNGTIFPVIELLDLVTINYCSEKINCTCKFRPEESFCHKLGYGGKIDLIIETPKGLIIIDFKTKQGKDLEKKLYDDYCMQLAAYADYFKSSGQEVLFCGNLLISVTDPGVLHLHKWSDEEIEIGFEKFKALLRYWQLANKFDSSIKE